MEKELNIAAILNEKPTETKLWSPMLGDCIYCYNNTYPEEIIIAFTDKNGEEKEWTFSYSGRTISAPDTADVCLFPSKQMRDWHKFAWKKGDVLESDNKLKRCIFEEWANDDYTDFNCFAMDEGWNDYFGKINISTFEYHKADDFVTQLHIKRVEKKFGGKLNLETLEIEHPKPEFKDGDIAFADFGNTQNVFIISGKTDLSEGYNSFISLDLSGLTSNIEYRTSFFKKDLCKLRPATEEEKQQLFAALAKEGKRWNAENKQIEDLPKKYEFKPFQKVLAKFDEDCEWMPDFFYYYDKSDSEMPYVCIANGRAIECIPYNEETKNLLGTTDEWKGGE